RRVSHEPQSNYADERSGLVQDTCRVGLQLAAKAKFLTSKHDRGTVFADRTAHKDAIAYLDSIEREPTPGGLEPNAGGREIDTIAFASPDHLGVSGDHRYAARTRSLRQRIHHPAQHRDIE